jgi:hypothetical protein
LSDTAAYLAADAEDRRHALTAAVELAGRRGDIGLHHEKEPHWLGLAEAAYRFLRSRDSLRAIRVSIVPGTPYLEGNPMTATFNLDDTDAVEFTLTGQDAKGASVPLDSGFTAAWTLADPDDTGATLTVSADTTNATVAAGVPDSNLLLSVVVTNPDGSTLSGAEAIIVQATAATTVGLVAGTPTPE